MLRTHLCAGDETVAVRVHASELFGRALTSLFDVDALTVAVKSHAHPMGAAMAASAATLTRLAAFGALFHALGMGRVIFGSGDGAIAVNVHALEHLAATVGHTGLTLGLHFLAHD